MKTKIISICAILAVVITVGALACSKNERNEVQYVVKPGDTLWSIAQEFRPKGMDIRRYIFDIQQDNELNGSVIHAGDILILK